MSQHKSTVTFVMLTNGNEHAFKILSLLKDAGIQMDGIIYQGTSSLSTYINDTPQWFFIRFLKAVRRYWISRLVSKRIARRLALYASVTKVKDLNSTSMITAIGQSNADYLVLGGIGIINQKVIDAARIGVLNAHPGLLPWLRGSGVVARAIERGIPIGATTHFVDSSVDTGMIIERRLLKLDGLFSLIDFEDAADRLIAEMMTDLIIKIRSDPNSLMPIKQNAKFLVCKRVLESEIQSINSLIKAGEPWKKFAEWTELSEGPPHYRLKDNIKVVKSAYSID